MNILFYMDPFVDYVAKDLFRSFVLRFDMMPGLLARQFGEDASIKVICHERTLEKNGVKEVLEAAQLPVFSIRENEIRAITSATEQNPEDIIKGHANQDFLAAWTEKLESLLEDWVPDIVIGWGIIPDYVLQIYGSALVLEAEHSALFRLYSEADTFFFPRNESIHNDLIAYIKNIRLSADIEHSLQLLKEKIIEVADPLKILTKSYFGENIQDKKVIFYPGHFPSPYSLRFSKYLNDEEIISDILAHSPEDALVLYLKHPLTNEKDIPSIVKLSDRVIDISSFSKSDPHTLLKAILVCDIFINSHSKSSFLAFILEKHVIELDNFYYKDFATNSINHISEVFADGSAFSKFQELQKKLVYFLLTHTISQRLFQCEKMYKDTIVNIYDAYTQKNFDILFQIMTLDEVREKIHSTLIENPNKINRMPTEYDRIKACIISPAYKNICFDIFDTLVWRPFNRPADIFYMMARDVSSLLHDECFDFFSARISAEWHARREKATNGIQDVTIEDIYTSFSFLFDVSPEISSSIKELEEKYEKKFIQCRKSAKNLVLLAKNNKKNIYAVSDMYLSSSTIADLLQKAGYPELDKIIISCEEKYTKESGLLFKHIVTDYNIDPKTSIFIGDNIKSDVKNASKNGFRAFHYPKATECLMNKTRFIHANNIAFRHSLSAHIAVIANIIFDNPYISFNKETQFNNSPFVLGLSSIGPFLTNFTGWLIESIRNKPYEVILFSSRDCYFISKIYSLFREYTPHLPKGKYFYLSRRATIPCFTNGRNIALLTTKYNSRYNCVDFIDKYFPEASSSISSKNKKYLQTIGTDRIEQSKFQDFLKKNIFIDEDKNEDKIKLILEYIQQESEQKEFALVDSGARGTSRDAISQLLNRPIDLYLLRSYRYKTSNINNTFVYHKESFNYFRPGRQAFTSSFYEPLISSCHEGSCEGYIKSGEKIIPQLAENEDITNKYNTFMEQYGILFFAQKFINIFREDSMMMINEPSSEFFKASLECSHARMSDSIFFETSFYHDDPFNADKKKSLLMPPLPGRQPGKKSPSKSTKINISRKNSNFSIAPTSFSSLIALFLVKIETIFILFTSKNKQKKYYTNRSAFFMDSRHSIATAWYKLINKLINK